MREMLALRPSEYSADDRADRPARAALRSYVYEFCDAGNEIGRAFRSANPRIGWEGIAEMRYSLLEAWADESGLWGLASKVKVARSGNSLVLRIPSALATYLKMRKGQEVMVSPDRENCLVLVMT